MVSQHPLGCARKKIFSLLVMLKELGFNLLWSSDNWDGTLFFWSQICRSCVKEVELLGEMTQLAFIASFMLDFFS